MKARILGGFLFGAMAAGAAAASRLEILQYAARNNIPVGGMHLVYPAVGTVRAEGEGYAFTPAK